MKRVHPDSPDLPSLVARLDGAEALAASAREHKAFLRPRKIKSAADLLQLLITYASGGLSLRSTAAVAADAKLTKTTQGERLDLLGVVPGALYLGDRNYPNAEALSRIITAGAALRRQRRRLEPSKLPLQ